MVKNRISPRHPTHDYTSPWGYFVTIVTKDRRHCFGEVVDGSMVLNGLGKRATDCRNEIPSHYPFVEIHAFVCMPNHIHGILIIGDRGSNHNDVGTQYIASPWWSEKTPISKNETSESNHTRTDNNPSLQKTIGPKSWSLWSIIRGYKIGVTKYARHHDMPFARQSRYHDRIIRDQTEYDRITYYIQTNPQNRNDDSLS